MRKFAIIVGVVVLAAGAAAYSGMFSRGDAAAAGAAGAGAGARQGGGGGGFPGGPGAAFRPPMTIELTTVGTGDIKAELMVVGNLIGAQTVDVAPKTGGRLVSVSVRLGDAVRRGQVIAKVEDQEIVEQVRQAEASLEVAKATIRQREADLKVAELNFDRSKNLYDRQLLAKQALDDAESRDLAAQAQLDLSRASLSQTAARLEELRINLQNTTVVSPVDGFVSKRNLDPGAWVSTALPVVSVVEISTLRLVANVVEKDLRMVNAGDAAVVEVDAYPGDKFTGEIARVAPVLDPTTRTAQMEVQIPNRDNRLKPGMYARVTLTIEDRKGATIIPRSSVVDYENKRGVFVMNTDNKAQFVAIVMGVEEAERVEVRSGLEVGAQIIGSGAQSLRQGDTVVLMGQAAPGAPGTRPAGGRPAGTPAQGQRPQ